ncbi:hypothetical protein LIER_14205 [Lithospermum erythrorhizon]|uniref:Uncharacterized protein n=1 Tax=Lithospermum erythrorhizon TaxID=34254 RepID=A0AAV3Q2F9_LITER
MCDPEGARARVPIHQGNLHNKTQFIAGKIEDMCKEHDIDHMMASVSYQQANGQVEDGGTSTTGAKRTVLAVGTTKAFSLPHGRTGNLDNNVLILIHPLQVLDQKGKLPGKIALSGGMKALSSSTLRGS